MNNALITIGAVLMIAGALFSFITLGLGIICTWPLILVGIILVIIGAIIPIQQTTVVQQPKVTEKDRYCPKCGREIPFDAKICPYCKKDFEGE